MTYTEQLADLIVNFHKVPIPPEVIEHTKLFVMDTIGCALGGYATEPGKQIAAMAKEFSGGGEASLIGDGSKVSLPFACWANSSLANILDMDDVYSGTAHQANCLVPTALGIGEARKATGKEVLRSIVAGFEIGSRIMMYCWPTPAKSRTYYPSTWQVFDAVTAAGILLQLDPDTLYHAFGLAGAVPPLPIDMQKFVERPMGFAKNVFGWTTFTGLFWTMMAQKGAAGMAHVFDGDAGFWAMMGSDQHNFEALTDGFGEKFNILETKYKPYPLCTWGHTSVDCLMKVLKENSVRPAEIEAIEVRTIERVSNFLSDCEMITLYDAQFSLPHALSMVVLGKKPGPEWMCGENMFQNEAARSIASKVAIASDPEADRIFDEEKGLAIPAEVRVRTGDGRLLHDRLKYSKGTSKNPFTEGELKEKFRALADPVVGSRKAEDIIDTIMSIDRLKDITPLIGLIR